MKIQMQQKDVLFPNMSYFINDSQANKYQDSPEEGPSSTISDEIDIIFRILTHPPSFT